MYLWKMVISGNEETTFEFTEHTAEKEKKALTPYFKTDQSYSQEEPTIKPIIQAAIELCKTLNIDLKENYVHIQRGFKELSFICRCGVFNAVLRDGLVVVGIENDIRFTREQYNAIFDFINVVKETNWFF